MFTFYFFFILKPTGPTGFSCLTAVQLPDVTWKITHNSRQFCSNYISITANMHAIPGDWKQGSASYELNRALPLTQSTTRVPSGLRLAWFPWSLASWPSQHPGISVALLWLKRLSYWSKWPDWKRPGFCSHELNCWKHRLKNQFFFQDLPCQDTVEQWVSQWIIFWKCLVRLLLLPICSSYVVIVGIWNCDLESYNYFLLNFLVSSTIHNFRSSFISSWTDFHNLSIIITRRNEHLAWD